MFLKAEQEGKKAMLDCLKEIHDRVYPVRKERRLMMELEEAHRKRDAENERQAQAEQMEQAVVDFPTTDMMHDDADPFTLLPAFEHHCMETGEGGKVGSREDFLAANPHHLVEDEVCELSYDMK